MIWLRMMALVALAVFVGCASESPNPMSVEFATLDAVGGSQAAGVGVMGSVTGGAHLQVFSAPGLGLRKLTFNAIQQADGSVSGEWNLVAGASILHGDIDCLNILPDGKVARLSGIVTDAKFTTFQVGTAFAIELHDNGNGGSGAADETSSIRAFRNASPEVGRVFCETGVAPADLDFMGVERGNASIHVVGAAMNP